MGAVTIRRRELEVTDPWKALMYWCAIRNLAGEVVYSNLLDEPVHRIEANLPKESIPTAYTAYRERFGDAPADYSEVYCYGDRDDFARRFGPGQTYGHRNIFVLKSDKHLASLGRAPLAQVYADLWNIETWYAKRYLEGLGERIKETLGAEEP